MPSQIQNNKFWWKGPQFLNDKTKPWPIQPPKAQDVKDDEFRRNDVVTLLQRVDNDNEQLEIIRKFEKLTDLLRTVALCFRFISNCRSSKLGNPKSTNNLRPIEVSAAWMKLITVVQGVAFKDDIRCLKTNTQLPKSSKLLSSNGNIQKSNKSHLYFTIQRDFAILIVTILCK